MSCNELVVMGCLLLEFSIYIHLSTFASHRIQSIRNIAVDSPFRFVCVLFSSFFTLTFCDMFLQDTCNPITYVWFVTIFDFGDDVAAGTVATFCEMRYCFAIDFDRN